MVLELTTTGIGKIFSAAGLHQDGWCETAVRFKARPTQDSSLVQFDIWLKQEPLRAQSHLWVSVNDGDAFECALPHNCLTSVQVACVCEDGQPASIAIGCDNIVSDKGEDVRNLSYNLHAVHFS